jgi:hypothetical protein
MTVTFLSFSGWHLLNVLLHISAGLFGIALGLRQLWAAKGDAQHRRVGLWFVTATAVVVLSAAVGVAVFRFLPLFAVLTVLVGYQLVSGWRDAINRQHGPAWFDLVLTLLTVSLSAALVPTLRAASLGPSSSPAVVYATLGALGFVLAYDVARWLFPSRWHTKLWLAAHLYKMLGALFGMIAALVGNVVVWGQPWSQIAPSALGTIVVAYWLVRLWRDEAHASRVQSPL